jgi:hypothetical protein
MFVHENVHRMIKGKSLPKTFVETDGAELFRHRRDITVDEESKQS